MRNKQFFHFRNRIDTGILGLFGSLSYHWIFGNYYQLLPTGHAVRYKQLLTNWFFFYRFSPLDLSKRLIEKYRYGKMYKNTHTIKLKYNFVVFLHLSIGGIFAISLLERSRGGGVHNKPTLQSVNMSYVYFRSDLIAVDIFPISILTRIK